MSNMNGNPYITDELADFAKGTSAESQATTAATLAVAYEQRTANLIAAFNASVAADEEIETFIGERIDTYELSKQIVNRLGLNGVTP